MRISDWSSDVCSSDLHDHALAGGQAVGLDHDRRALVADVCERVVQLRMDGVVRGGDTVAGKEILGEGFASLQLRGGGGGAEDAQALGAEAVDDAGDQRSEEHTSELQSLMRISYAVFCLKKK